MRSVERQLAEHDELGDVPPFDDALCGEDTERDRQVERRAGLAHVGRREVDGDAVRRELEPGIADGTAHAVAALAHARVGQADHRESRQAERHIDLDVDGRGVDAKQRGGPQTCEHRASNANAAARRSPLYFQSVSEDFRRRRCSFCYRIHSSSVQGLNRLVISADILYAVETPRQAPFNE